ncbi:WD40 repeat-like protein [Mycena sanguinolenta]|uniref:WD40 repeat-like protein n=1 Tax=Mycena sanguinolenta TaxID=230812 RepID=A0A8H7CD35_9AGAR|nr:WD40 repeat-like protein [Mycena sanguinolenta]
MVRDVNSSGSASPFEVLDQLYLTILGSARRHPELIQILCVIVIFRLVPRSIDQVFGFARGETRLILRDLHSVLKIPQDDEHKILSHHASFLDFLKNPDRSGNFCVGILHTQISLARTLLQYHTGPFERHRSVFLSRLIRFIVALPPSVGVAELFPLIGTIEPDHIFDPEQYTCLEGPLKYDDFKSIVSWLKSTSSAPADIIELWEDYAFMFSIETRRDLSIENIVSPNPEIIRILITMWFLCRQLWEVLTKLDLTWTDLRTTLCSLRPKAARDGHALPIHQPQANYLSAARNVARQLIRKIAKNYICRPQANYPWDARDLALQLHVVTQCSCTNTAQKTAPSKKPTPDSSVAFYMILDIWSDCPLLAQYFGASFGLPLYFSVNFGLFHHPN